MRYACIVCIFVLKAYVYVCKYVKYFNYLILIKYIRNFFLLNFTISPIKSLYCFSLLNNLIAFNCLYFHFWLCLVKAFPSSDSFQILVQISFSVFSVMFSLPKRNRITTICSIRYFRVYRWFIRFVIMQIFVFIYIDYKALLP